MAKITIIGWYGTETIGDRGILGGIIKVLFRSMQAVEIRLGSILPFFTERTLLEDERFLRKCSGQTSLPLSLFDSSKSRELDEAIRWADLVVVGGGPLEDIPSMFMLEYALKKARKCGKKTLLLGCGIGPLYKRIYQRSMVQIVDHADTAVFRDAVSIAEYRRLGGKKKDCIAAIDPAVFALMQYKSTKTGEPKKCNLLVISVREFPAEYKMNKWVSVNEINQQILKYIRRMQEISGKDVLLVPMHYFGIGDDDRYFMNDFRFRSGLDRLQVQNRTLSLEETMELFTEAEICVGMRFHSVVFQTLLNGNNLIWDYTDPATGKIGAFVSQIKGGAFYRDRYIHLQTSRETEIKLPTTRFSVETDLIAGYEQRYVTALSDLLTT